MDHMDQLQHLAPSAWPWSTPNQMKTFALQQSIERRKFPPGCYINSLLNVLVSQAIMYEKQRNATETKSACPRSLGSWFDHPYARMFLGNGRNRENREGRKHVQNMQISIQKVTRAQDWIGVPDLRVGKATAVPLCPATTVQKSLRGPSVACTVHWRRLLTVWALLGVNPTYIHQSRHGRVRR